MKTTFPYGADIFSRGAKQLDKKRLLFVQLKSKPYLCSTILR
ncbi:hypothetical protein HMPREF2141_00789 [Bacteroides uniformis]|uniref:Uncharacterized protein n=2 Tax=Bacteroides uniformis TaxID=820 RepID=A0A078SA94_BACUN|nr:hypothetical protein BACUNI_03456 [Bacteroides uniformis ATCC 8492]KDS57271.1 hypothetical protein M094_3836 [Bacteroides uniformis str. 3978 T3 ii]KDS58493.1 hypothetical protein M093_3459 [Bacteroides uniformis str. 3978 T3 i]KXT38055.1 hypothetical protein HMPREF2141_00789 [Bacteroides uniformis]